MIAAPASTASHAESAISSGVTGKWGDIEGVWIDPVMAHVMMTLPCCDADMRLSLAQALRIWPPLWRRARGLVGAFNTGEKRRAEAYESAYVMRHAG
jgi:hypothetical protein